MKRQRLSRLSGNANDRNQRISWHPSRGILSRGLLLLNTSLLFGILLSATQGQGPGVMGGGGAGAQAPAFDEPKFLDKVWEAGGPVLTDADKKSGKLIVGVVIRGNQSITENAIISHMQSREDRIFDQAQLQKDIRALYRTELFERVDSAVSDQADGVVIKITVQEKPTVKKIIYQGNTALDESTLSKNSGIKVNDPIGPTTVRAARDRLLDLYHEKGFNDCSIDIRSGAKPGDREAIFIINEGELERIGSITIVGNTVYSTSLLKTKIASRDSRYGFTRYMFNVANFDKIADDAKKLEQYYKSLGYLEARTEYFYQYDESGKFIDLTYVISEGPQYSVAETAVEGNKYYDSLPLVSQLELKQGEPFHLRRMLADAKFLRDVYGAQGFIFVDVTPELTYLSDSTVKVTYRITEGDVYRASDIRVHIAGDSSHTKSRVVWNYLGSIRPGQILDSREIENAERRLKGTAMFAGPQTGGEPPRIEVKPVLDDEELDLP